MNEAKLKGIAKKATAAALLCLGLVAAKAEAKSARPHRASVEVVFVLDTTGSMGGLLEAAKQKVWGIANEIAKGKPTPKIRMGLIAYRDKSDKYVTQVTDLTTNLDKMYEKLLALKADGGGDGPEHVLKGLEDAIEKISWSADKKTFKVVYLVGDAPAHLDYKDTPELKVLTERAVRKGLILNTVQCGSDGETTRQWRRIARLGEGKYLAIPHNGGVVAIATPFDGELARLNTRLDGTMLGYGRRMRETKVRAARASRLAALAPASAAADRATFKASRGFGSEMDLAEAVEEGKIDLDKMKKEALPEPLKKLSPKERR
ncbi:MAG: vWA domain-containing protein, partial [Elusimicrobiota bacterium]